MDVVLLTHGLEEAWQQFVDDSPQATLGHLLGWRSVVQKTYHHTPYYLMAIDGRAIKGLLPLFLIRSPFSGRILATAPYLPYRGLLPDKKRAVHAARTVASERRVKSVAIRGLSRMAHSLFLVFTESEQ